MTMHDVPQSIGRIACWEVERPVFHVLAQPERQVGVASTRRYGVIERVDPGGTAHVRMLRAYDPETPPSDEGRLIALRRGQWNIGL